MTYSLSSPLTPYVPPGDHWLPILAAHGAYGGADAILSAYDGWCHFHGIDANLALAQFCHETGYGVSDRWKNEWNPAGLRITSPTTPPNPFASLDAGIRAHCEHLCCHAYDNSTCPADHAHLSDRYHVFHRGQVQIQDIQTAPFRWAAGLPGSDPLDYVRSIVSIANGVGGSQPMPRIIVHAGHEHIGNITADKIGQPSADNLRHGTGANGEMEWNSICADQLTSMLRAAGADAVRTDAIWHPEVYDPDADLVFAIHYDGVGSTGRAQYCMASTVHSGPSTEAADSLADAIVQEWYASYPAAVGIVGNGPITDGMQQYYGGWYRTANTPMMLAEHCIGADGGGIRADRPTPQAAAAADFAVLAKHFGLSGHVTPEAGRTFPETGRTIKGNIKGYWERFGDDAVSLAVFGLPVTDLMREGGIDVQYFERACLEDHAGNVMGRRLGAAAAKAAGYHGPGIDP